MGDQSGDPDGETTRLAGVDIVDETSNFWEQAAVGILGFALGVLLIGVVVDSIIAWDVIELRGTDSAFIVARADLNLVVSAADKECDSTIVNFTITLSMTSTSTRPFAI